MEKPVNQKEINEKEWQNETNWKWFGYSSSRDTRFLVPRKPKWLGWTYNFGHSKYGRLYLILCVAFGVLGLLVVFIVPYLKNYK